jgi:hypothetical protein
VASGFLLARGADAVGVIARARQRRASERRRAVRYRPRECFERALEYLMTRKQFGVRIGSFQAPDGYRRARRGLRRWVRSRR